jgi:hypothetical protein
VSGYNPAVGARFYVQPADACGQLAFCTQDIREKWDPLWVLENEKFEEECEADESFWILKDKMFYVFDGNHRLYSWMKVMEEHPTNPKYHPRVICTIFKGESGSLIQIEAAMHTVNQYVSHVGFFCFLCLLLSLIFG